MKVCEDCGGTVALYVDGVSKAVSGWYCGECWRRYEEEEIKGLAGSVDAVSRERLAEVEGIEICSSNAKAEAE